MKRIMVISLAVVLMLIPIMLTSCDSDDDNSTNGNNGENNKNSVSWETGQVTLEAADFYIIADGKYFYANVEDVNVQSDPGTDDFTLEVDWEENGVEMRFTIYFYANQSNWWSEEIRTYDGQENGEWIYYTGVFFKTSVGSAYTGDVDLYSDDDNDYTGEIHIEGLTLETV